MIVAGDGFPPGTVMARGTVTSTSPVGPSSLIRVVHQCGTPDVLVTARGSTSSRPRGHDWAPARTCRSMV